MAQVAQIRSFVNDGLLSLAAGRQRLLNLGWRDPDLTLLVSQWGQQLAAAAAKAQAKGQAAAQAAAKAAARVRQQALRQLMRAQPVAAIGAWYRDGTMSRADAVDRLTQYGYDAASIGLYLRGWDFQIARRASTRTGGASSAPLSPQRQVPVSRLRQWFLDGIVDESFVRDRMGSYGYDRAIIDGYVTQWTLQGAARASQTSAAAPL